MRCFDVLEITETALKILLLRGRRVCRPLGRRLPIAVTELEVEDLFRLQQVSRVASHPSLLSGSSISLLGKVCSICRHSVKLYGFELAIRTTALTKTVPQSLLNALCLIVPQHPTSCTGDDKPVEDFLHVEAPNTTFAIAFT